MKQRLDQVTKYHIKKMIEDPFLQELANGTLDEWKFKNYKEKDKVYLEEYAKLLTILSKHNIPSSDQQFFSECTACCLQEPAFKTKGEINDEQPLIHDMAYINFIKSYVHSGDYSRGVFSVFPCFEAYFQVARQLQPTKENKNNDYISWFEIYRSELFVGQTNTMLRIMDVQYNAASTEKQNELIDIVKTGIIHERQFFHAAYCANSQENALCPRS